MYSIFYTDALVKKIEILSMQRNTQLPVCQSNGTPILLYSHKQFYVCLWEYFYALIAVIITTTMIHKI